MDSSERNGGQEPKAFNQLSFEEQEKRFDSFRHIFSNDAQFKIFWDKAYKHPDAFEIENTPKDKVPDQLSMVARGVVFIPSVLNYFRLIKLKEVGQGNQAEFEEANFDILNSSQAGHFVTEGHIDVQRLSDMFEWSLLAFVQKNQELRHQSPDIDMGDIPELKNDLTYMANKINDYLH